MKKVLTAALICILTLAGCGRAEQPGADALENSGQASPAVSGVPEREDGEASGAVTEGTGDGQQPGAAADACLSLRIVDGAETGSLVLAGEGAGAVYTLTVGDTPVYLDGVPADASVLEDGMTAEISFSGMVMETYPAQLADVAAVSVYSRGTEKNPGGGFYDLCGLYLQVLNDLWETDSGLNEGVSYVSVDLSEAPGGLTEGEKSAIAWIFACEHQMGGAGLCLSYQELKEQGYLAEVQPDVFQWEDGVLFSITACEADGGEAFSLPVLTFDAQKWRSPLGAYWFDDCTAVWPETGSWEDYSVGGEMVSQAGLQETADFRKWCKGHENMDGKQNLFLV